MMNREIIIQDLLKFFIFLSYHQKPKKLNKKTAIYSGSSKNYLTRIKTFSSGADVIFYLD